MGKLVEALIVKGEELQETANKYLATAQNTFNEADAAHKTAVATTMMILDIRNAAQSTYDHKLKVEGQLASSYSKAQSKTKLAVEDQERKQKISDADVPVIDHEDAEFEKVIVILKKYQ